MNLDLSDNKRQIIRSLDPETVCSGNTEVTEIMIIPGIRTGVTLVKNQGSAEVRVRHCSDTIPVPPGSEVQMTIVPGGLN